MISTKTAKRMAAKFFAEQRLSELNAMANRGRCIEEILKKAKDQLGRKGVVSLYKRLPRQLRHYTLRYTMMNSISTNTKLCSIDNQFRKVRDSKRPERLKKFSAYMAELEKVFFDFLAE